MEDALSSFQFLKMGSDRSHCPVPGRTPCMVCLWCCMYGSVESHCIIFVRLDALGSKLLFSLLVSLLTLKVIVDVFKTVIHPLQRFVNAREKVH
jgi:hypothetical protein